MSDGTIVTSDSQSAVSSKGTDISFEELLEVEQWDDLIEYHFECSSCRAGFSLFVETYHGQGGSWSPVS